MVFKTFRIYLIILFDIYLFMYVYVYVFIFLLKALNIKNRSPKSTAMLYALFFGLL